MSPASGGNVMSFIEILHDYGWAGVLLLMVTDKIFPFIASSVFPQLQKEKLAKIEMAKNEQEHRFEMDNRQVEAVEGIRDVCQNIDKFMVSMDRRMSNVERSLQIKPAGKKKPRSS
jgi:valyl-tRNA synthetase